MKLPLEGVTVLDLTHALAGPFCSTMLADYGAHVIKLEAFGAGDIARTWGTALPGGETAYFVSLHRNKKGIEINLKHPRGKALFFDLVARCDIVIENFRVGTLQKLGLDYDKAKARNPGIIYCSVSGFGQSGPYRDRPALDLILQAESGMISVTGEPGGRGVRCGVSIADLTAGLNAAFGIMAALRVKEKTGRGQQVDVSMMEGQMALLHSMIGSAYTALTPYQTFRTQTHDFALAVGSEKLWKTFCPAIGHPELTDDPRYATNRARMKNRDTLIPRLQEIFLARTFDHWEKILLDAGIPFGALNNIGQVINHPQVKARGSMVEIDHPKVGKTKIVGPVAKLSETPATIRSPSPSLGEHTEEVLREFLELAPAIIADLREAGVIRK
jgi:crotonobetainyl-CoA:carnitine CoA-transferase CaiB-like acyl-CoA transferase